MKRYKELVSEVLGTISKANEYLDANERSRKAAMDKSVTDIVRKRIAGAHKAIDRLNKNIERERERINK